MRKRLTKALVSVFLAAALFLGCMPMAAAANDALQIGVISDTHYFSKAQAGDYCDAFMAEQGGMGKLFLHSEGLLDSALAGLAAHAKQNGMKFVLVAGDLTRDGELDGHKALAARLERFEKETGLQVAVIPGNHDINNSGAMDYSTGVSRKGATTSPEQFREVYANLGFDLPGASYFTPSAGKKGGMLSYAVDLGDNYRLLALDTGKYSADQTESGENEHETGGMIGKELMDWAVKQCKQAVADGKAVIGMGHHNLTPHIGAEEWLFLDFVLDDWLRARETLADAGMHYYFSGHIHQGEIGDSVNDNGEVLYDICTASLVGYPCTFREVLFSNKGKNNLSAQAKTYEVDCVKPVTSNGVTYDSPFSRTSFALSFSKGGIREYLPGMLDDMLGGLFKEIEAEGGLSAYLGAHDIDLETTLDEALGGGLKIGSLSIVGAKNIVGLLNDIFGQVDKHYIKNSKRTIGLLNDAVEQLLEMQVSQYPSTAFIKDYGIGDASKPGSFADMASEALIYVYGREGGAEKNKFMNDAIDGFEHGENTQKLIDILLDVVLNDLLQEEILKTLQLNLSPALVSPVLRLTVGAMLDGILCMLLMGDNSFSAVVDLVFNVIDLFNIMPYSSLDNVVETLLEEYWTPTQTEEIGYQLATIVRKLIGDQNDVSDLTATLKYTGPRKVTATQEDFRLPSMVTQMLPAQDDSYDRAISWFTKDSVKGTDIVVRDNTGKDITKKLDIKKKTEAVEYTFPGVDLGLIGFITASVFLTRHTVEITGLDPNVAYSYQAGDASRGWWSPQGVMKVPLAGNQDTTFLSFTDQQSGTPNQYERAWGTLSKKAIEMYPDALFALSAGDQVDYRKNLHQWTWFFDSAQSALRQLPLMPAAGNHEDGDAAMQQYFPFGSLAGNDESGIYYSFDVQNLHIAVLNTNNLEDDALAAAQTEWLKKDLAASEADWNIVMMHKSLYSNGSHISDSDVAAMRAQLPQIFEEYGVDVVISGHDHTYLRTEAKGTQYVMAGTSGVKLYNTKPQEEVAQYFTYPTTAAEVEGPIFCAYEAKGNTLVYKAYMMDTKGSVKEIDSFTLQKDTIELRPAAQANWDISSANKAPNTGDAWTVAAIPMALLIAAGFVLFMLQQKRTEEQAA